MEQQQCIFCGIANGGVPSKTVYEDSKVRVVLDIYPANPAHLLVLTKQHYAIFNQLSQEEAEHIGIISKRISELMFKVLKPEGINFFIANGPVAGQKAPHMILHVIPRFAGDGLNFSIPITAVDEKELGAFYENLKTTLNNYFPEVDFESAPAQEEESVSGEREKEKAGAGEEKNEEVPGEKTGKSEAEDLPAGKEGEKGEEQGTSRKEEDIDLDKITERLL